MREAPTRNASSESIASAHLAAAANVLVLRTHQQAIQVLEVPSVKEIASFTVAEPYARVPSLSPNGRLLAAPGTVPSGKVLWTTDKYQDVIAWGPQWDMVVLTQAGTTAPQMLDTRTGKVESYPAAEKRVMWALPTREGRLLVGNQRFADAAWPQRGRRARGACGAMTVANVKGISGQAFPLPPRFAFVKRAGSTIALVSTVEAEDAQDLERSISDAMVTREIAKLQAPVPPSFSIVPLMPGDLPVASTGKPIVAAAPRGMDKPMLDVPPDSPNCAAMLPAMWAGPRPSSRGRTKGRSSRWIDDTTVNARDPDFGTGCSCLSYLHRPLAHQTAARADQLVRQFASLNAGRQCS